MRFISQHPIKKSNVFFMVILVANIIFLGFFFFRYLIGTAPWVGHDYRFFIPTLIDNYLFVKVNGLAVHWYTPSFAGGLPVYANPQDIQFSLPQLLTYFVNPWQALRLSVAFYVVVGFLAIVYFLNRQMEFNLPASILGAIFFSASGFYLEHMAVGDVTFQTFPMIGFIMILLFNRKLTPWLGGLLLSLITTLLIYSGSFIIITLFILTILLSLPIIYIIKPELFNWRHILFTTLWGVALSFLICGSKLYAVYSLMKFTPRLASDNYTVDAFSGLKGLFYQLLGAMTIIPIHSWLERSTVWLVAPQFSHLLSRFIGSIYGMWEMDISLSPSLLIILVGGLFYSIFRRVKTKLLFNIINKKQLIAEISLVFLVWFVVEFSIAKGLMYPVLHNLPILKSLRANVRFPSSFIFPLAITGAAIFHQWTKNNKSQIRVAAFFIFFNILALVSLDIYNQIPSIDLQKRLFDIRQVESFFAEMRKAGEFFPVKTVIPKGNGWKVFQNNATNLDDPFDPLFKGLKHYFVGALHAGSVSDINNGYYNMINPTGYVYPSVNGTKPYERIRVSDEANFQNFINRRQTNWKFPIMQKILNWLTVLMLITAFLTIILVILGNVRQDKPVWFKKR